MVRILFLTLCLFAATAASADEYIVSQTGTWGTACPATFCGASGDTWSYSFQIDSTPVPLTYLSGHDFDAAITNFSYLLNGTPASALTAADVIWYSTADAGGFSIPTSQGAITIETASQLYSGPEAAPVIQTGPITDSGTTPISIGGGIPFGATDTIIQRKKTPEPSTYVLSLIGIGFVLVMRKRVAQGLPQAT
jgi:hypothetical protein